MIRRREFCVLGGAALLAGCGRSHLVDGKPVTMVIVNKRRRLLHLMYHREALRSFPIELGFAPEGHKQFEGDGKTPEGMYVIDRRNPRSQYHLSVGVSYPNARDRAFAQGHGKSPGGDIFIHGTPAGVRGRDDWTAGCIAVENRVMNLIFHSVRIGTPILITR